MTQNFIAYSDTFSVGASGKKYLKPKLTPSLTSKPGQKVFLLNIRICVGLEIPAKIFTAEFDIRNNLKNGAEDQNSTLIVYWIFGCLLRWGFRVEFCNLN